MCRRRIASAVSTRHRNMMLAAGSHGHTPGSCLSAECPSSIVLSLERRHHDLRDSPPDRSPIPPAAWEAILSSAAAWPSSSALPSGLPGCRGRWPDASPTRPRGRAGWRAEAYIGSGACRECHPGEYALHGRSGHARTLARRRGRIPGPKAGWKSRARPGTAGRDLDLRPRDGRLHLERARQGGEAERFLARLRLRLGPPCDHVRHRPRPEGRRPRSSIA